MSSKLSNARSPFKTSAPNKAAARRGALPLLCANTGPATPVILNGVGATLIFRAAVKRGRVMVAAAAVPAPIL